MPAQLELTDEQMEMMKDACARTSPREACGVVAGGVCYELPNHSDSPASFELDPAELGAIAERHGGFDAVWHTHPSGDPLPSRLDWAYHPHPKAMVVATRTQVSVYYGDPEA